MTNNQETITNNHTNSNNQSPNNRNVFWNVEYWLFFGDCILPARRGPRLAKASGEAQVGVGGIIDYCVFVSPVLLK
ncbi:MAG: hypothetical protein HYT30_02250 [Parcubacteria group bacterium]|nr:hypothetical protein [Parcubacteria group bacterium]